jgi:glucosamine-6-phosphate deaminase
MRITTYASTSRAAGAAARQILDQLTANPKLVMGLPTGNTPIPMYRALVRAYERGEADFSQATTFNLDEFAGLGPDDPGSYRAFMNAVFFSRVNVHPTRVHLPDGLARNWRREVARYEQEISDAGGLDLVVLGLGGNGHIGFNEPGPVLDARTHRVALHPASRRANAHLFGGRVKNVPTHALSMGIGTILNAKRVLLLATGAAKASIVARALAGPLTTRVPASLLQTHPDVVVVLDREAASRLPAR